MRERWRRFWRVLFMLEKPTRPYGWLGRALVREYPELRHFTSRNLGWRARSSISLVSMTPLLVWTVLFWIALGGVLWVLCIAPGWPVWLLRVLVFGWIGVWWGGSILVWTKLSTPMELRLLRRRLLRLGIPVCIRCGYEPGSWTDRCPECGRPIRRPIAPPE